MARHRDELVAAGVPDAIFSDELRWCRFLEECGLGWETGWRVEMLTPQQAIALHGFITREFQPSDIADCARSLMEVIRQHGQRPSDQV